MFELIKTVITAKTYTDSNAVLSKIKRCWVQGDLTEEQYEVLTEMLFAADPVKDYAMQEEIDRIWAAIREIQRKMDGGDEGGDDDEIPDYVQPTGAHDAYQKGDKVRYNGKVYESLIDGNVWAPDVYPAGWKEVK